MADEALRVAAMFGSLQRAQEARAAGAELDAVDEDGSAAIHNAAANGSADVVQYLLEQKAQVDLANADDRTPLNLAADHGHESVGRLLLRHGGTLDAGAVAGLAAADKAARVAEASVGVDVEGCALHFAAFHGRVPMIEYLLSEGVLSSIDPTDDSDKTPLHWAAQNGHAEACELLVRSGAELSAVCRHGTFRQGLTPLELAEHEGQAAAAKLLQRATHNRALWRGAQSTSRSGPYCCCCSS